MKDRSVNSEYPWGQVKTTAARRNQSPPKKNREARDAYPLKLPERFDIRRARKAQRLLSRRIVIPDRSELDDIELVAGVDVAYWEDLCFSAAVVVSLPNLAVTEVQRATCKIRFPYVPTLLAYREGPAIIRVIEKLRRKADVYMFDGHGLAHPFRLGLASHLGVVLGIRSIGVAKNLLHGAMVENGEDVKTIRMNGDRVGVSIESGFKPIYVSAGNLISLEDATEVVRCCIRGSRLPEPIRIAHRVATGDREKRKERQQLDAVNTHDEPEGKDEKTETIVVEGEVVSGLGEGAYYISLDQYKSQFKSKLGFEPYPGTLNIRLSKSSLNARKRLDSMDGIIVKGFEKEDRTFGDVKCFKALIEDGVGGAVVIIDRTHYTASILEVVAPVELRRRLRLKDGDKVKVGITVEKTGRTRYRSARHRFNSV